MVAVERTAGRPPPECAAAPTCSCSAPACATLRPCHALRRSRGSGASSWAADDGVLWRFPVSWAGEARERPREQRFPRRLRRSPSPRRSRSKAPRARSAARARCTAAGPAYVRGRFQEAHERLLSAALGKGGRREGALKATPPRSPTRRRPPGPSHRSTARPRSRRAPRSTGRSKPRGSRPRRRPSLPASARACRSCIACSLAGAPSGAAIARARATSPTASPPGPLVDASRRTDERNEASYINIALAGAGAADRRPGVRPDEALVCAGEWLRRALGARCWWRCWRSRWAGIPASSPACRSANTDSMEQSLIARSTRAAGALAPPAAPARHGRRRRAAGRGRAAGARRRDRRGSTRRR